MRIMHRVGTGLKFASVLLAAVLLTGCAQTIQYPRFPDQAKKVEDPSKARIYVLRPARVWASLRGAVIYGPDFESTGPVYDPRREVIIPMVGLLPSNYATDREIRRIGDVGPGGYICWETPPHPFTVIGRQDDPKSIFTVNLVAGHVYYLRTGTLPGFFSPKTYVKPLTDDEGAALLKKCDPPESYRNTIKR